MKKKEARQKRNGVPFIFLLLIVFIVLIFLSLHKKSTKPSVFLGGIDDLQTAAASYTNSNYADAIKQYRQIIEKDPQNYEAHLGLAGSYLKLNIYDEALKVFEKTKSLQYHDFRTYYGLGLTYYTMEDYGSAYANFKTAYDLNPNSDAVVSYLLNTYNAIGLYDETLKLAQDKLKSNPSNSHYYRKIALAYLLKNDLAKSLENAQKAVAIYNSYAPNHLTLANVYLALNDKEKALNEFETASGLAKSATAYEGLSITYSLLGDAVNSRNNANSAAVRPKNSFSSNLLGFALLNIKEYDKAIQEFNSAIGNTPEYYLSYKGLGKAYMALGQKEKAIENFEKAVKLNELDEEGKRLLEGAKK